MRPLLAFSGSRFGTCLRWRDHVWRHADLWVACFGPPRRVLQGEATGVDTFAKAWAYARGFVVEPYHADWETFGNAAGIYRNEFMIDVTSPGDHLLAFPHEQKPSPGTWHCIDYTRQQFGRVVHVYPFA